MSKVINLKWDVVTPSVREVLKAVYFQIVKHTKGIDTITKRHIFLVGKFKTDKVLMLQMDYEVTLKIFESESEMRSYRVREDCLALFDPTEFQ